MPLILLSRRPTVGNVAPQREASILLCGAVAPVTQLQVCFYCLPCFAIARCRPIKPRRIRRCFKEPAVLPSVLLRRVLPFARNRRWPTKTAGVRMRHCRTHDPDGHAYLMTYLIGFCVTRRMAASRARPSRALPPVTATAPSPTTKPTLAMAPPFSAAQRPKVNVKSGT